MTNLKAISLQKLGFLLGKAYKSCDTLPLYNFIEVVTSGSFASLVIWGKVFNLENIWGVIHEEYVSLTKDTSFGAAFRLIKEIHVLNNKLLITDAIVRHLSIRRVPELCIQLQNMGFKLKFEDLKTDLPKVVTQSKSLILRLNQAQTELSALTNKEKVNKEDYYAMLSILGKFKGADINPRNYTVMQFISDSNLYKKSNAK